MLKKSAMFSPDKKYRYQLSRIWKAEKGIVCFVGNNPSIADANIDDPTIRREIRFVDSWGYGGLIKVNLYGYISTDPKALNQVIDPVGPDNDSYLSKASFISKITILAWGANARPDRVITAMKLLTNKHYLALTQNGSPRHPLYLKKDLKPIPWAMQ